MPQNRFPFALMIATLAALLLGMWLTLSGLALSFFGVIPSGAGWIGILARFSFGPDVYASLQIHTQAWLRIVVGTAFAGGTTGLWLRQRWAPRSIILLSALAITFSGLSLLLVPLILICLALPSTRGRIQPELETHASQVSA
jgi:hypothetical protein